METEESKHAQRSGPKMEEVEPKMAYLKKFGCETIEKEMSQFLYLMTAGAARRLSSFRFILHR